MATKTETTTTSAPATNGSEAPTGERSKLGFVPTAKLASIAGPKAWSEYQKRAEQIAELKAAQAKQKSELLSAISKKLNLGDTETVEFSVSGDKLILYRRAADKPKKQPMSAMADLTA